MNGALDAQRQQWQENFAKRPEMFGADASEPARTAAQTFADARTRDLLELGAGQGRDTIFFAKHGFRVTALDYSEAAIMAINSKAREQNLSDQIKAMKHDVRQPLPFPDSSFDACYSHMLFCMALSRTQLQSLAAETRRVLRPGGLHVFTVRHTGDPHYGTGIHRGEDMFEVGGFIVHFFSRAMVEQLSSGYELLGVDEFEEGKLPRKLFRVTLRKKGDL